jgi:HPt (histidine-containing phosphotransfer) domain-containing protein
MDNSDKFAEVFATLSAKYVDRARTQRERLAVLRDELMTHHTSDVIAELMWICHSLHGASGTFGYPDVGVAAANAERLVKRAQSGAATDDTWQALDAALVQLHQTMEHIP